MPGSQRPSGSVDDVSIVWRTFSLRLFSFGIRWHVAFTHFTKIYVGATNYDSDKCDNFVQCSILSYSCHSFCSLFSFPSYFSCMLQSSTPSSSSGGFREPLPPPEPTVEASGSTQNEEDPLTQTQATKPARSDPGKVPKWLKLPGQDRK